MLRTTAAIVAGKAARAAARVRGGGSAMPGLVAERIDPQFLAHALSGVSEGIVVVTGTNGKTTTTKMLAAILRAHGKRVFSNPTGSNFTRGVISSMLGEIPLSGRLDADMAVLELDEAHALRFTENVKPTHSLLLNVAASIAPDNIPPTRAGVSPIWIKVTSFCGCNFNFLRPILAP